MRHSDGFFHHHYHNNMPHLLCEALCKIQKKTKTCMMVEPRWLEPGTCSSSPKSQICMRSEAHSPRSSLDRWRGSMASFFNSTLLVELAQASSARPRPPLSGEQLSNMCASLAPAASVSCRQQPCRSSSCAAARCAPLGPSRGLTGTWPLPPCERNHMEACVFVYHCGVLYQSVLPCSQWRSFLVAWEVKSLLQSRALSRPASKYVFTVPEQSMCNVTGLIVSAPANAATESSASREVWKCSSELPTASRPLRSLQPRPNHLVVALQHHTMHHR